HGPRCADPHRRRRLVSLAANSLHISAPRRRLAAFSSSPLALLAASFSALRCIRLDTNLCTEFLARHTSRSVSRILAPIERVPHLPLAGAAWRSAVTVARCGPILLGRNGRGARLALLPCPRRTGRSARVRAALIAS